MSHIFRAGRSPQHRSLRNCFPRKKKNHASSRFVCHQSPSPQSFYCTLYRCCVVPPFATRPPPLKFYILPSLCFAVLRQASSATSRPVLKASILPSICCHIQPFATSPPPLKFYILPSLCFVMLRFATGPPPLKSCILPSVWEV